MNANQMNERKKINIFKNSSNPKKFIKRNETKMNRTRLKKKNLNSPNILMSTIHENKDK